ncbi:MAG: CapA family protein, partial [Spirochaetia bacterium]|nr:CapA family protein [Spirochaetia bacterium]
NSAFEHNLVDIETKKSLNNHGFDFLFEKVAPALRASDAVIGNLEFPVMPPYISKPWIFNCRPEVIPAIKKAGIGIVTIANNHILDHYENGALSTMDALTKYGVEYIGAGKTETGAGTGYITALNGVSAGIIACTGVSNHPVRNKNACINWFYNEGKISGDIASMKQKCDYVIMVVHTGSEYIPIPSAKDRALMKKYLDAGVDLIIGHHPHIVQPVERYTTADGRETCIFYSLGNFISNQGGSAAFPAAGITLSTRNGLLVTVNLRKEEKILSASFDIIPIKTVNEMDTVTRKRRIQTTLFENEETAPPAFLLTERPGENTINISQIKEKIVIKKLLKP